MALDDRRADGLASDCMKPLDVNSLKKEAKAFSVRESNYKESSLFGVTDGKAVGTYLEQEFQRSLAEKYTYSKGNTAKGIDFPELDVDIKVTSIKQPQSSCPYRSARQEIYGLGYSLLVFVYEKTDDDKSRTSKLNIRYTVFVEAALTADFQMTSGLRKILENHPNKDDILAFMQDRLFPVDEMQAEALAEEILRDPPPIGYLTISNALQWRLQYSRVIDEAGRIDGLYRLA